GFLTGWALFLDYLIVIALAALFVPHYFGSAIGWDGVSKRPWDTVVGVGIIVAGAAVRLMRRRVGYKLARFIRIAALVLHVLLIVLGLVFLFTFGSVTKGVDVGTAPTWSSLAFALPLAMLAFTGLETVANLAAEIREPGKTLPRSLFGGIALTIVVSVLLALIGLSAYPPHPTAGGGWGTDLGTPCARAPLVGIGVALDGPR